MPIIFAALRFGWAGTLLTSVASGVLAGPLLPLDVTAGTSQAFSDWGMRSAFFVGELELSYNRIEVPADPGLMIVAYTPEPGSKSAEAFGLLASWAATETQCSTRASVSLKH